MESLRSYGCTLRIGRDHRSFDPARRSRFKEALATGVNVSNIGIAVSDAVFDAVVPIACEFAENVCLCRIISWGPRVNFMVVQNAETGKGGHCTLCHLFVANHWLVTTFVIRVSSPIASPEPRTYTILKQLQPWSLSALAGWVIYHTARVMLRGTPSVVTDDPASTESDPKRSSCSRNSTKPIG